jgi:hypothetical protein
MNSESMKLASELEFEYPCERCHKHQAVVIFDRLSVCAACHKVLERELVTEAARRGK